VGSDFGELSLFGIFVILFRKLNCHAPGCWRIGLHKAADGTYVLCRKHHPDVPRKLTLEHIHQAHAAHKARIALK
jgi:hypothetical protein